MVNQTLISFKCDIEQLVVFDSICSQLGVKRNRLLNFLVAYSNVMFRDVDKLRLLMSYASALDDLPPLEVSCHRGYVHSV